MIQPPSGIQHSKAHLTSMEIYNQLYQESINDPNLFWEKQGKLLVEWSKSFSNVLHGSFERGNISWFSDGELNVSYNCIDRHVKNNPEKAALIFEQDEPGHAQKISYSTLLDETCRLANVLKALGIGKGDNVAIYMPMIPEAVYSMLACARIGAVHSVVFAGFSSEALRDRINDASCQILITADQGKRGGKYIHLKKLADEALKHCSSIRKVLVFKHTGDESIHYDISRDLDMKEEMQKHRPYCPPVNMNAEDPLFLLYTSGSTGKPKGLVHTCGGYLVGATATLRYTFDLHPEDVFGCVADVGWITGHSYIVYGPLSNGATTLIFESIPTYPDAGRYWKLIEEHRVTQFYTAPTAIRALKRLGDHWVTKYDLNSLRVIGTVGEPINPEAWHWFYAVVGRNKCAVVDTYWQTETGSFLIAPYATVTPTKPGSCTLPQFGISPEIVDAESGKALKGNNVDGVLCIAKPWPSMARTILNGHDRFLETYLKPYHNLYFTGDGAHRDVDGYYWIKGRVDDVINVSGHRLSTAEIETALCSHEYCAEAAVIGAHDDITGQSIFAFCTLKLPAKDIPFDKLCSEFISQVRKQIGPFSAPKKVVIVPDLPKTRSGKIMRRILRKIVASELDTLGDTSTLADPNIIPIIIKSIQE